MTSGRRRRSETVAIAAGRPERKPWAPFNEDLWDDLATALQRSATLSTSATG